jgi:hypothetical protein
MASKYL